MQRTRNFNGSGELKSQNRVLGIAEYQVGFWIDADGIESGAGRLAVDDCRYLTEDDLTLTFANGETMPIRIAGNAFGLAHAEFMTEGFAYKDPPAKAA